MKKQKIKQEIEQETEQFIIINNIPSPFAGQAATLRTINLYGDVTEELTAEVVSNLLFLEHAPRDEEDPESLKQSIRMFISTHGGNISDMFSIIDVMKMIQKNSCEIETIAIGKVMSAGVLILAAGSKGKRKIGRNCRVMLHGVSAGSVGTIFKMENELEEIKWLQDRFVKTLSKDTNLKKSKIKEMLKSHKDIYISAKDAIKFGIADEII